MGRTTLSMRSDPSTPPLGRLAAPPLRGSIYSFLPTKQIGQVTSLIAADPNFRNPYAVMQMSDAYRLQSLSLFGDQHPRDRSLVQKMREAQNKQWADDIVVKGVACARQKDYSKAQQYYDEALSIDPNNVDALVARGAASANTGMLEAAIEDFTIALRIDPHHANAQSYLRTATAKLAAQGKPPVVVPPGARAGPRETDRQRSTSTFYPTTTLPAAAHRAPPAEPSKGERWKRFLEAEEARAERKQLKHDKR